MDKKLRRVQRWIERCREACGMKKWDMALMEIESARADLDAARSEIWQQAEADVTERPSFSRSAGMFFRRGGVAVCLLFLLAVPLSVGDRPALLEDLEEHREESLAFVTRDEREILTALRKSLSGGALRFSGISRENPEKEVPGVSVKPLGKVSSSRGGPSGKKVSSSRTPGVSSKTPEENLGVEDVLALVQMGERALRGSSVRVVTKEE